MITTSPQATCYWGKRVDHKKCTSKDLCYSVLSWLLPSSACRVYLVPIWDSQEVATINGMCLACLTGDGRTALSNACHVLTPLRGSTVG